MQLATLDGRSTTIPEATLADFRKVVRGEVLVPGVNGYEIARKVFNAMIDKRPGVIVRCAGPADVIEAINFARTHGLLVSVRGGGHGVAGKAVCDNGIMIDLSLMKGIRVDPKHQIGRAQPGLRLGEFDRETQGFGLATTLGIVSNTGIAGLTLGGGIGWLNGKYGLACDNLLSVDIVTADGQLLTASADENQDMFWAVRGGGGNFGVVTSLEYQLHPTGPVLGGMVLHPVSNAKEVLRFYDNYARGCPDELSTVAGLLTTPDEKLSIAIVVCYSGSLEAGEEVLKPLRTFGPPRADLIKPMKYVEMQGFFDTGFPDGQLHYWKANFLRTLSDDAIETMTKYALVKPSPNSLCYLQHVHGATSRVSESQTAFPHRHDQYDFAILSIWPDRSDTEKNVKWAREFWEAMQPFTERGVYVNGLGEEGEDRVKAAYGGNYERLMTLKKKYDPQNLFRLNQNINPSK